MSWPTPQAHDASRRMGQVSRTGGRSRNLEDYVTLASWPTPTALSSATEDYNEAGDSCNLRKTRLLVSGPTATGSPAETAKPGQLNPAHSRWLMGYPRAWDDCAVTAMPSCPKSPPRSSKRTKGGKCAETEQGT